MLGKTRGQALPQHGALRPGDSHAPALRNDRPPGRIGAFPETGRFRAADRRPYGSAVPFNRIDSLHYTLPVPAIQVKK